MDYKVEELVEKVNNINLLIQSGAFASKDTFKELEDEVKKLKDLVIAIDKEMAIYQEKHSSIYVQLNALEEKIETIKESSSKKDDKKKDTTEKVFLLVLGSLLSLILTKFT